jgi:hypothetical protein
MSTGVLDESTGALFSVDAFGAIIPEATQHASDVPPEELAGGMLGWATTDSPWVHISDRHVFGQVLDRVRKLQPSRIFSSHLPAADGTSLEEFLEVLAAVPDAEPFMPPDAEQFTQMIEQMAIAQQAESTAPTH